MTNKVGDVLPNEEFAVALTFDTGNRKAETVDVQINSAAPTKSGSVSGITIDEDSVSSQYSEGLSSGSTLVITNGEYTNDTELNYDSIMITTLLFDKDGNIIGAGTDDQWNAVKGTRPFEIYSNFMGDKDDVASTKNYSHVYKMN